MDKIINRNSWSDIFVQLAFRFNESPFLIKILLTGGFIIILSGGMYLGYRFIRRISGMAGLHTIITSFVAKKKLTIVGRVLEAIIYRK